MRIRFDTSVFCTDCIFWRDFIFAFLILNPPMWIPGKWAVPRFRSSLQIKFCNDIETLPTCRHRNRFILSRYKMLFRWHQVKIQINVEPWYIHQHVYSWHCRICYTYCVAAPLKSHCRPQSRRYFQSLWKMSFRVILIGLCRCNRPERCCSLSKWFLIQRILG